MSKVILGILTFGVFFLVFFGLINIFGSIENNGLSAIVIFIAIGLGIFLANLFLDKAEEKLENMKENSINNQNAREHFAIYSQTKENSSYLSDDFILNQIKDSNLHIMKKLASEEILVERGVIQSSPTHEKLALIKQKLRL